MQRLKLKVYLLFRFIVAEDFPPYQKFGSVRLSNGHMMGCVYAIDKRFVNTFQINRRGELSLVSGLDRERMSEYRFNVSARVASTEPAAVEVVVQVGDVRLSFRAHIPMNFLRLMTMPLCSCPPQPKKYD